MRGRRDGRLVSCCGAFGHTDPVIRARAGSGGWMQVELKSDVFISIRPRISDDKLSLRIDTGGKRCHGRTSGAGKPHIKAVLRFYDGVRREYASTACR